MTFLSDTTAPAHPAILEALRKANDGDAPSYGADAVSARVKARLAELFETDLEVVLTSAGTAANALALAVLCPPDGSILCHEMAHIHRDERGAPEFFTGGAKLIALAGDHGWIDPHALQAALESWPADFVHSVPPKVLSLTLLNEAGCVGVGEDTRAALARRIAPARDAGLFIHMDGARFANALPATGLSPADLTWRAGVDVLCLGATKGGAVAAEAILLFPSVRERLPELLAKQKRSGHMAAKLRYVAAQMEAWLGEGSDGRPLCLSLAEHANRMAARLAEGLAAIDGTALTHPVHGNEVFIRLPEPLQARLRAAGVGFYAWPDGSARFVTSWSTTQAQVEAAIAAAQGSPDAAGLGG